MIQTALGTGIHDDFCITKLRYYKIVLMADADVGRPAHHRPPCCSTLAGSGFVNKAARSGGACPRVPGPAAPLQRSSERARGGGRAPSDA